MANALYGLGRQGFLEGTIAWLTANIDVDLVDSAVYTPSINTHQYRSSVNTGGAVVATSNAHLGGKTSTLGVADASDIVFSAVSGAQSEYLVIYKNTTVDGTSPLIALIDTATGLPVTPNGGDINVAWSNGSNKIFML